MTKIRPLRLRMTFAVAAVLLLGPAAHAQDRGSVNPKPLPPLANPDDPNTPAKSLFGRRTTAAPLEARVIGFYSKGCLAGAKALPINGKTWQVMRLSRNRNWGHPHLIEMLERLSAKGEKVGWPGLLVGDISQPRGGPMLTGHASHQIGLDADIWLTPMPARELSRREREEMSATMVVAANRKDVDPGGLDAGAWRDHQGRRTGAAGRAHLRQRRDQEGAVPRSRQRPALAAQGAGLLRARLSFPHPHQMPGRQS
jgi:penicillin-insensitive murein endopeptidase